MKAALEHQINSLRELKISGLKARYRELFGEESRSSNRAHLLRRIAWRLQAMAQGDLSERARERARELACDFDLRVRAPRTFSPQLDAVNENAHVADRDCRLPPIGTELTREYNGHVIRVKVLGDGFEHNGRWHSSLSAVASHATGTRWNGFSFFGLNRRQAANE